VYFTMRLVRGRHLGEVFELARRGEEGWSRERILIALIRVCEAMAYAHAKGVVHRDLKPANVMTGRFGEVYVMDWGLAKVRGRIDRPRAGESTVSVIRTKRTTERERSPVETSHGTVFGTPAYMSPEQARGDVANVDERSDVYSLGTILYHHLVGHQPYAHGGAHGRRAWCCAGSSTARRRRSARSRPTSRRSSPRSATRRWPASRASGTRGCRSWPRTCARTSSAGR
jgi:serine/threonine-protein kinase